MMRKTKTVGVRRTREMQSVRERLPGFVQPIAIAFIVSLPFATMRQFGLLGNFDSNLALWPFLLLLPFLLFHPLAADSLLRRGPEATIIRALLFSLTAASIFTIINGIELKNSGVTEYKLDPLRKSLITSIVPLFIWALYLISVSISRGMNNIILHRCINFSFWIVVAYTIIQAISLYFPNPLYGLIWPFFEGAKDFNGIPYSKVFYRLNGTTSEPAELVKLVLLFFLPWIIFPIRGNIPWAKLASILLIVTASQSIIGIALLAISIILTIISGSIRINNKINLIILIIVAAVFALGLGVEALDKVFDRMGSIGNDQSAQVRATYNSIALDLIFEHPFIGLGWSNEIFYYPDRLKGISYLWEVQKDIEDGVSLTARSLMLRLGMYTGIPVLLFMILSITYALCRSNPSVNSIDKARTRFAFIMFALGSLMDGGIITSFFMWAATALPLGFQMRSSIVHRAGHATSRPLDAGDPHRQLGDRQST